MRRSAILHWPDRRESSHAGDPSGVSTPSTMPRGPETGIRRGSPDRFAPATCAFFGVALRADAVCMHAVESRTPRPRLLGNWSRSRAARSAAGRCAARPRHGGCADAGAVIQFDLHDGRGRRFRLCACRDDARRPFSDAERRQGLRLLHGATLDALGNDGGSRRAAPGPTSKPRAIASDPPPVERPDALSRREWQVAVGLADGRSYDDLACEHQIAAATVRTYVNRVNAKLGIRGRAALVRFVLEHTGAADPERPCRPRAPPAAGPTAGGSRPGGPRSSRS
ncbi:MAG: helix-turn-helix transcriptional regulator [Myxococcales bacterium]|nr:helix-turn-helix transcriptional regulator [Myxococcales bacterium]